MTITIKQRVTVAEKQLHGNQSNISEGSVISISGESAKVLIDGETLAREFPVEKLQSAAATFGYDRQDPSDNQVMNQIRRN
jgi:glutamine synthetase type III